MNKYSVEFKGTKDGVVIYCLEGADFAEILEDMADKLRQRASFFASADVRVDVGTRELSDGEKEQIARVIQENSKLKLLEIQTAVQRPVPPAKRRGETAQMNLEGFKEGRSLVIKRTLRSGQDIHFPGHVIILGDVNPGAEIIAEGDIYVFGTLRGIAHAGSAGDRNASVVALRLAPTQLRIANVISRAPDDSALPDQPEYACISEDRIIIAAITIKMGL